LVAKVSPGQVDLKRMALALGLALYPAAVLGQSDQGDPGVEARAAQVAFERFRVARLPWSWEPASGSCDEIVGRFCYRHESGFDDPLPLEPEGVAPARDSLLARLDRAAETDPADGWIAGQRVRYRTEAGRAAEAVAVAETCAAEGWWCAALEGAARHAAEDFAGAERAFDRALAAMPAAERERWEDIEPLLDGDARALWRGLGPGGRVAFAARLWWAADPLWSVPGNERRAEHLARRTWDRMQEGAASAYDVSWGRDLSELLVRYGWPAAWELARGDLGRLGGAGRPPVVARDPPGAKRFLPTLAGIADPAVASPADWPLDDSSPRATYAPSYAERFVALEPQLARFRRGSGGILVVGWEFPRDALPDSLDEPRGRAALFASEGPDRPFAEAHGSGGPAGGALSIDVGWPRVVVGVEARLAGIAARWRAGVELPIGSADLPAVSDLLLLRSPDELPATLEAAIPLTRGSTDAASGERVGIFWEAYPPRQDAGPVTVTVSVRGREAEPGALRWRETLPPDAQVVPRAVALEIPALSPGRYVIEVEMIWPGTAPRRARRGITILRD
jgi:hypothetical protein